MNVILQSLLSIPVFYNFLVHLNHQVENTPKLKEIFDKNDDDSLLIANFLELVKHYDPATGGPSSILTYGSKIVNVEAIFSTLLGNFNPDKLQQDSHEFLNLMLDTLNNELHSMLEKAGISTSSKSLKSASEPHAPTDEWEETGKKRLRIRNKAEDLIKNSPIFEIFGGCMREDICIEGKNTDSARLQPYLFLSLPITMECTIESSLHQYFEPEELEDYKVGQKWAYATKTHSLLSVPNILILHVKRFLYIDRPIKTCENIYYPDILELKDEYFAPEIQEERKAARKAVEELAAAKSKPKEETKSAAPSAPAATTDSTKPKKKKKTTKKTDTGVKVEVHEQTEEQKQALHSFKHLEKYELIGVIVHKGKEIQKGHYVAFVQDSYGNWLLCDDKDIKPVTQNIVLDQQAYLLIYRKFT